MERIWGARRSAQFRAEAAQVVHKHASRKDPERHFVQDRDRDQARARQRARRAKDGGTDDRQGSFDF